MTQTPKTDSIVHISGEHPADTDGRGLAYVQSAGFLSFSIPVRRVHFRRGYPAIVPDECIRWLSERDEMLVRAAK